MSEANLISLQTRPQPTYDINAAGQKELSLLEQVLSYFGKESLKPVEEKTYKTVYTFDDQGEYQTVEQISHYIKYDNQFILDFIKTVFDNSRTTYSIRGISLISLNGKNYKKKIAMFKDGELKVENEFETDDLTLDLPIYNEPSEEEETTIQGLDDCWLNGCCSFRYKGLPWNPVVTYKWCGKGCGNGCNSTPIPVNGLDSCCKTHDCCYKRNSSYPARCSCDMNLANCAAGTDFAGSDRVMAAGITLAAINGCD